MKYFTISSLLIILMNLASPLLCADGSNVFPASSGFKLTAEEKSWVEAHRTIRVKIGVDYPPFEFFKKNQYHGLAYDYLAVVGTRLGIRFEPVPRMIWSEALNQLIEKRGVDLILAITRTPERERHISFTKDYLSFPYMIFTAKDGSFISGINDLYGKVVAVERGYVTKQWLQRDLPGVKFMDVDTTPEALQAVATHKADACIENMAVGSYLIEKMGLTNIKVSAAASSYGNEDLAMGVRNDWPEIAKLIDKAIASITPEEHQAIRNKWLSLRVEHGIQLLDVIKWISIVGIFSLTWILLLRRMVKERTATLQDEVSSHLITTEQLQLRNKDLTITKAELRTQLDENIQIQNELIRSNELQEALLNNSYQFQGLLSVDGRLLEINKTALEFVGKERSSVTGKYFWDTPWWNHDPALQRQLQLDIKRVESGEFVCYETLHPDSAGNLHVIDFSLKPMKSANGEVIYLIAEGRDITKLKRIESSLTTIINSTSDLIWSVDLNYTLLNFNFAFAEQYKEHFGFEVHSGMDPTDPLPPDLAAKWHQMYQHALKEGGYHIEYTQSNDRILELAFYPIIQNRVPVAISVFGKDITQRKLAEDALRESEARLKLYFQRLPTASIVWDLDFVVKQWNPAAERIFGYSEEDAVGRLASELIITKEVQLKVNLIWQKLLEGNLDAHSINENLTKEGRTITCSWTNTPIHNDQGTVIGVISVVEDITKRMKMEAQLNKLSLAVEQSPVSIVITDVNGIIEYVNPKFSKLTGYLSEEVIGQNPHILNSGLTPKEVYTDLWKTISNGEDWQGEFCNIKKNGEHYWESASISPITSKDRGITHYVAVKEDITEKKKIVEELRLDAVRFQALYELSLMGEESEKRLLDFTLEASLRITGSSIGNIFFLNDDETIRTLHALSNGVEETCAIPDKPKSNKVGVAGLVYECIRRRAPVIINDYQMSNPLKIGYPDGHIPITRYMNFPLIDNGRIALLISIANKETDYHDNDVKQLTLLLSAMWRIIQKRKAENLLKESENSFQQVFEQSIDAIILVRLKRLKILDANPAALSLFGLNNLSFSKVNISKLFDREDLRRLVIALSDNNHSDSYLLSKTTGFKTDGEKIVISMKGKLITLQDEPVILCSIRDIRAQMQLEEEIKATQAKMIQTNKMTSIGLLVSGVGHEINNPNQCISTNASVLHSIWKDTVLHIQAICGQNCNLTLGGLPADEVIEIAPKLFSGISESSQKISKIVSNMRDFIKEEKTPLKGSVDVNRVINAASSILWQHIHKHTDNYKMDLQEGLPIATGSSQQIEQVVINLLTNALQSLTDKTRSILIVTSEDKVTGEVLIIVRDEGKGMGKDVLEKLTEPFFTTRSDEGGTGLGLYISSNIIKEHHGSLCYISEPGKGTTATIRLPIAN